MARFLKVEGGVATNAIKADAAFAAGLDGVWIEATGSEGIGWAWDGSAWTAPAEPTDAERAASIVLSSVKFKAALATALQQPFSTIDSYIAGQVQASSLSAADQDLALGLLAHANEFHRVDPDIGDTLLASLGALLGFGAPVGGWTTETEAEKATAAGAALDVLFIAAEEG